MSYSFFRLALRTLTALCCPGLVSQPPSLAGYFGPSTDYLRSTCLIQLESSKHPSLKESVLEFLAAAFEFQPGLAESMLGRGFSTGTLSAPADSGAIRPSLKELLQSNVSRTEELFTSEPQNLAKIFHILFCVWDAAPGYGNLAAELSQTDKFWDMLFFCLNSPIDDDSNFENRRQRLIVQSWVLQILAVELWSHTSSQDLRDGKASLAKLMDQAIAKGLHQKWLAGFTRCNENPELERDLWDVAQQQGLNLSAFAMWVDPESSPGLEADVAQYDIQRLRRLYLEPVSKERDEITDAVIKVNHNQELAGAQMLLTRSWAMFVQIALLKHPSVLGFVPQCDLPWSYLSLLCKRMVHATLNQPAGHILSTTLLEISRLLLMLLSHSLSGSAGSIQRQRLHNSIKMYQKQHRGFGQQQDISTPLGAVKVLKLAASSLVKGFVQVIQKLVKDYVPISAWTHFDRSDDPTWLPSPSSSLLLRRHTLDNDFDMGFASMDLGSSAQAPSPALAHGLFDKTMDLLHNQFASVHLLIKWMNELETLAVYHGDPNLSSVNAKSSSSLGGALSTVPEGDAQNASAFTRELEPWQPCEALVPFVATCISQPQLRDACVTLLPVCLDTIDHSYSLKLLEVGEDEQEISGRWKGKHNWDAAARIKTSMMSTVACIGDIIPSLLSQLANTHVAEPDRALKIMNLLTTLSQKPGAAHVLSSSSVMLYLCNNNVLRPPSANGASSIPSANSAQVNFAPYDSLGNRNVWHIVWCAVVSLVTTLLSQLHADHAFADQTLEFLSVYHRRLTRAIETSSADELTIGRVYEVEVVTSLLYEMEKLGPQWRFRLPQLAQEHKRSILYLSHRYAKLLNSPIELGQRATPVSKEEKEAAGLYKDGAHASEKEAQLSKSIGARSTWTPLASPSPSTKKNSSSTSPVSNGQSFLLRSPVVKSMGQQPRKSKFKIDEDINPSSTTSGKKLVAY